MGDRKKRTDNLTPQSEYPPAAAPLGAQGEAPASQGEAPVSQGEGNNGESAPSAAEVEMISLPAGEHASMKKELEEIRAKSAEYFEGWQRERADFSNYKRRVERDQSLLHQNLTGGLIKKYLVVMDDLERALKNRPTGGEAPAAQGEVVAWADGIELIYRKLKNILEAEGLTRIPAETELFDPTRHEAISHEDSPDHQSGQIIEVVQQGYMLGDRVLRPALVRVAR